MKIKGKTIIELHDAKTGKLIQRTEDNNMLTNALTEFYKQGGITNPSVFNVQTLRTDALHNLLGGILLLDTALEEDASVIKVPAGVYMTGNGAYQVLNSGNPTELGSWNENESGWQNDGSYKMVWDYTTSQANGTVACVCLTSNYQGRRGIGNKSGTSNTNAHQMAGYNSITEPAAMDAVTIGIHNNVRTVLTRQGAGDTFFDGKSEWTISKYAMPNTQVDIRDGISLRLIESKTVNIPSELKNLTGINNGEVTIRQFGELAFIMLVPAEVRGSYATRYFHFSDSYPIRIAIYDLSTDEVTYYKTLTPSTTGLAAFDLDAGVYPSALATEDYAVFSKYIFNLSNLTNVDELTGIGEYGTNIWAIADEVAESNEVRIDLSEATWYPVNASSGGHYATLTMEGLLGRDGTKVFRDPRYIATINNLEHAVTKDASKTMKVTYVVRFS